MAEQITLAQEEEQYRNYRKELVKRLEETDKQIMQFPQNRYRKGFERLKELFHIKKDFNALIPEFTNLEELEKETELFDITTHKMGLSKRQYKKLLKKYPNKVVYCDIDLANGNLMTVIVANHKGGFRLKLGNTDHYFIFDNVSKKYNVSYRLYGYLFSEKITIPIDRKIDNQVLNVHLPIDQTLPTAKLIRIINATQKAEISYATDPKGTNQWIKGDMISQYLSPPKDTWVLILLIIVTVLNFFIFIIVAYKLIIKPVGGGG